MFQVLISSLSADEMRFFASRDTQAAAANLRCQPVECPAPVNIPGITMSTGVAGTQSFVHINQALCVCLTISMLRTY